MNNHADGIIQEISKQEYASPINPLVSVVASYEAYHIEGKVLRLVFYLYLTTKAWVDKGVKSEQFT